MAHDEARLVALLVAAEDVQLAAAQGRQRDLDDGVGGRLQLGNGAVLDRHPARAVEDHCFHCRFLVRHLSSVSVGDGGRAAVIVVWRGT